MSDWIEFMIYGGLVGFLLGQLFTRWSINGYYAGKVPDEIGHRTGIMIKGEMYYLVTGFEYVEGVLKLRPSLKPREEWRA